MRDPVVIEDGCGVVQLGIVEQMGVYRRGDVRVRMSKLARDDDQRDAPGEHDAGAGVSETVRRDQRPGSFTPVHDETSTSRCALQGTG